MEYKDLIVARDGDVGVITLNRPGHLNALSANLFREIGLALTELDNDISVVVVVFTGSGRAFSAGADIHEMVESKPQDDAVSGTLGWGDWLNLLVNYKKPLIGAINGLAYGGGALLASCFDLRVGCENTSFRFLAVTVGRINSTWSLPAIVGASTAKELLLTGRVVLADEAYRLGLLNRLAPAADLMKTALEIAHLIAKNDAHTVQLIKQIVDENAGLTTREALTNEINHVTRSLKIPPPQESFKEFLNRKSRPH